MTARREMPNGDIVECAGPGRCRHCDNPEYQSCRCCGEDVLPFVAGSYPEHQLCDDCGRGKCTRCINEVRAIWGGKQPQRNPEQDVIDAIDALVDDQLAGGPRDDYSKPYTERCPQCGGSWHGLKRGDCPGATGIEGNPEEGAKRDTDVWARQEDTDNPMTRAARNIGQAWSVLDQILAADPDVPPSGFRVGRAVGERRPPYNPIDNRHPSRQQFAISGAVALHWDDLPPIRRGPILHPPGSPRPGVMTLDIVTVQCAVFPCTIPFQDAWEFRVATSRAGDIQQVGMVITTEFLRAGYRGTRFSTIPLRHLGVEAELVLLHGGTVVMDVPHPGDSERSVRMGFLGAGGLP
ncbi:hypothetical protein [Mycolicibacterium fortuitum]|uniref:hypothetical protein n=1 Tax=Mycolicibacterium fortuitum TaxID=1766 RepID=UPI0011642C98|nr:hypothetical protein [Mycolicibacterium fortuitum]QDF19394.1 hypothetical protein SEA_CRACKLEWINK_108 [Mycobacterium phage Cracklewink]UBV18865.1 hypothetical protein H8Z57_29725 [Mycolicibacterium fortuitum]